MGFPGSSVVKNLPPNPGDARDWVQSLGQENPLEKEMATHFSILAWRILWTEVPGGLQSTVLQRASHDWTTENEQKCIYVNASLFVMSSSSSRVHKSILYICVSILALYILLSVPFFYQFWKLFPFFIFLNLIIIGCSGSFMLCTGFL